MLEFSLRKRESAKAQSAERPHKQGNGTPGRANPTSISAPRAMLRAGLRSACAAAPARLQQRAAAPAAAAARALSSLARPADLPVHNEHRSNAEALVNALPVILVQSTTALCDGGGGATGHPVEYMKLDKREGASPVVCKYCGLRYKMAPGGREWWWGGGREGWGLAPLLLFFFTGKAGASASHASAHLPLTHTLTPTPSFRARRPPLAAPFSPRGYT
jgi:NADH dehydrogenase (ubiquinone) Fe-S protein 6